MRKGSAFPVPTEKRNAARLSLAAGSIMREPGKAEPYRTGCGKAAKSYSLCCFFLNNAVLRSNSATGITFTFGYIFDNSGKNSLALPTITVLTP